MPDPIEHREARERLAAAVEEAGAWHEEAVAAANAAETEAQSAWAASWRAVLALVAFDRAHPGIEEEETG